MKIGIVAIHPFTGSLGTMEVISETSKELSRMGVEIHIFTPFENNKVDGNVFVHKISSGASQIGFENRFYGLMRKFYSSPFFVKNLLLRKWFINTTVSSLVKNLLPQLEKLNLDVLQGEQDIPALACIKLGEKLGIPTVAHIRNFWPEECVDIGLINRDSKTYQFLCQMVGGIVHDADLVFTVSRYARQFLTKEYGVEETKVVEVPRGARPLAENINYANKEPSVVYSGSISPHENLPLFVRSVPIVQSKMGKCAFHITGRGGYKSELQKFAERYSANISFRWFPKRTECQTFISKCSVGVIPWANTFSRRFGFPIKALGYMSVGLPLVITDFGEWSDIVRMEKLGIVTENTPESFAQGILDILNNEGLAEDCGRRGLNIIRSRYNWVNTAKILMREYGKL